MKDYISFVDPNVTLSGCYGDAATAASQAFFCPRVHRTDNGHGSIFGAGFVDAVNENLNYLATTGVDFEANYQTQFDDWGMDGYGGLSINFIGTYLQSLTTSPTQVPVDPQHPTYDCAGLFGVVCGTPSPTWRHKMRVTWTSPWDLGAVAGLAPSREREARREHGLTRT